MTNCNPASYKYNLLRVENFGEIKTSSTGKRYRRIIYRDEMNNKTSEYVIFENNEDKLWKENPGLDGTIFIYFGKIVTISLTPDRINKANPGKYDVIRKDGELDIVLLGDFEKNHKPTEEEIIRALKNQIWKITRYQKRQKVVEEKSEDSYDSEDSDNYGGWTDSDLRHANFIALTDGMYGDYDDFRGNWDDIDDWAGK